MWFLRPFPVPKWYEPLLITCSTEKCAFLYLPRTPNSGPLDSNKMYRSVPKVTETHPRVLPGGFPCPCVKSDLQRAVRPDRAGLTSALYGGLTPQPTTRGVTKNITEKRPVLNRRPLLGIPFTAFHTVGLLGRPGWG